MEDKKFELNNNELEKVVGGGCSNGLCSRCRKKPAVRFISRDVDGKAVSESYCVNCFEELGLDSILSE